MSSCWVITDFFGRKFTVSVKAMDTSVASNDNQVQSADNTQNNAQSPIDKLIDKAKDMNIDIEIQ